MYSQIDDAYSTYARFIVSFLSLANFQSHLYNTKVFNVIGIPSLP